MLRSFLFLFLITSFLLADTIVLKNGNRLKGQILEINKNHVVIDMAFGTTTIAKSSIRKIIKEHAVDNAIHYASKFINVGDYGRAIEHLKKEYVKTRQASLRREIAQVYKKRGKAELQRKNHSKAIQSFKMALLYDKSIDVQSYFTEIRKEQNAYKEYLAKGNSAFQRRDFATALVHFKNALFKNPESEGDISEKLAVSAVHEGDKILRRSPSNVEPAKSLYDLALEYYPDIFPQIEKKWLYVHLQSLLNNEVTNQNWTEAETKVKKILAISPEVAPAIFLLGLVNENQNRGHQAYVLYQRLVSKKVSRWNGSPGQLEKVKIEASKIAGLEALARQNFYVPKDEVVAGPWRKFETPHFIIYHKDNNIAKRVAETLEIGKQQITAKLASHLSLKPWEKKCTVYVYPSKKEYQEQANPPYAWSQGYTKVASFNGRFFNHIVHVYQSAPLFFSSLLPHELTHVLVPWFMGYKHRFAPWIDEGLAVTNEPDFRKRNRLRTVRLAARKQQHFSFDQFFQLQDYPEDTKQAQIFYAQSYSLVEFLLQRGGSKKFFAFATEVSSANIESLIQRHYRFRSLFELEKAWQQFIFAEGDG